MLVLTCTCRPGASGIVVTRTVILVLCHGMHLLLPSVTGCAQKCIHILYIICRYEYMRASRPHLLAPVAALRSVGRFVRETAPAFYAQSFLRSHRCDAQYSKNARVTTPYTHNEQLLHVSFTVDKCWLLTSPSTFVRERSQGISITHPCTHSKQPLRVQFTIDKCGRVWSSNTFVRVCVGALRELSLCSWHQHRILAVVQRVRRGRLLAGRSERLVASVQAPFDCAAGGVDSADSPSVPRVRVRGDIF